MNNKIRVGDIWETRGQLKVFIIRQNNDNLYEGLLEYLSRIYYKQLYNKDGTLFDTHCEATHHEIKEEERASYNLVRKIGVMADLNYEEKEIKVGDIWEDNEEDTIYIIDRFKAWDKVEIYNYIGVRRHPHLGPFEVSQYHINGKSRHCVRHLVKKIGRIE